MRSSQPQLDDRSGRTRPPGPQATTACPSTCPVCGRDLQQPLYVESGPSAWEPSGQISGAETHRPVMLLVSWSISNLEGRAILGPRSTVIVDAGGGDVGVTKPLLHLGDVGLVIERVGGGRGA